MRHYTIAGTCTLPNHLDWICVCRNFNRNLTDGPVQLQLFATSALLGARESSLVGLFFVAMYTDPTIGVIHPLVSAILEAWNG